MGRDCKCVGRVQNAEAGSGGGSGGAVLGVLAGGSAALLACAWRPARPAGVSVVRLARTIFTSVMSESNITKTKASALWLSVKQ